MTTGPESLSEALDEIAAGRCAPTSLSELASKTGQPTTLIRIRAQERGLDVLKDIVHPPSPRRGGTYDLD
jgi:hypothetical protein